MVYLILTIESLSVLQKRHLYRVKLHGDLRKRFRLEYLGRLGQNSKKVRKNHGITVGEVFLVENKNLIRKIVETFPGKDGVVRLVKVKTAN